MSAGGRPRQGRPRQGRRVLGPLCALCALCAASGALLAQEAAPSPSADASRTVTVDIVSHGWHTGVVIPIDREVLEACPSLREFAGYRTVEIGWGDEGFYRAKTVSIGITVRALAWPTPSVVHVVGLRLPTEEEFEHAQIIRLELTPERFRALVASLAGDFAAERSFAVGRYGPSAFFRGRLPYRFPRTCNAWTLRKLADAGFETSPFFGLRAEVAMHQVARSGTAIRLAPREGKWPYTLGALVGLAWVVLRRRRRARAASDVVLAEAGMVERPAPESSSESTAHSDQDPAMPTRDRSLLHAWLVVIGSAGAMLVCTVLSANGHAWGSLAARGCLVVMTGGFAAAAGTAFLHWRDGGMRLRGLVSLGLGALSVLVILSPM